MYINIHVHVCKYTCTYTCTCICTCICHVGNEELECSTWSSESENEISSHSKPAKT